MHFFKPYEPCRARRAQLRRKQIAPKNPVVNVRLRIWPRWREILCIHKRFGQCAFAWLCIPFESLRLDSFFPSLRMWIQIKLHSIATMVFFAGIHSEILSCGNGKSNFNEFQWFPSNDSCTLNCSANSDEVRQRDNEFIMHKVLSWSVIKARARTVRCH